MKKHWKEWKKSSSVWPITTLLKSKGGKGFEWSKTNRTKKNMKRDPHLHGSPSLLMHTIEPLFIQSTTNIFHNQSTFHSLKGEIRMEGERSTQSHNAYFSLSLCKVYNTWIIQHHVTGVFGNILRNLYKELGYI